MNGGTLQTDEDWILPTLTNWDSGTLKSSGIITNSGTLNLGGSSTKRLDAQLNNTGTIIANPISNSNIDVLDFADGAILNNSGSYEFQTGEILRSPSNSATINNSGIFKKKLTIIFNRRGRRGHREVTERL